MRCSSMDAEYVWYVVEFRDRGAEPLSTTTSSQGSTKSESVDTPRWREIHANQLRSDEVEDIHTSKINRASTYINKEPLGQFVPPRDKLAPSLADPHTPTAYVSKTLPNMETLAEPGAASHGHFQMNMSGYYPKPDTPSYYYPGSNNQSSQSFNNYHPGYSMVPESEHRAAGQGGMYPPQKKYPKSQEDVRGEKSGGTPHQQPQHSPVSIPSYHQYMHQTQRSMPLSYFTHPSISKSDLFKDLDNKPDQSTAAIEAENTKKIKADSSAGPQTPGHSFPQNKFNPLRTPVEHQSYPVAKDMSQYNERLHRASYYMHASRQLSRAEDSHQSTYKHLGYSDSRASMKSSHGSHDNDKRDSPSVKAPLHVLNDGTTMFPKERATDHLSPQYREWMHDPQLHEGDPEQMMNLFRKKDNVSALGLDASLSVNPFNFHKEGVNMYNFSHKDEQFLRRMKERHNLHSGVESLYTEKNKDMELQVQSKETANSRPYSGNEGPSGRSYSGNEGANARSYSGNEAVSGRSYSGNEAVSGRPYSGNEAVSGRPYSGNEATLNLSRAESERCRSSPGVDAKEVSSHKLSESSSGNSLHDLREGGRSPVKPGSSPGAKTPPQDNSFVHNSIPAKISSHPPSEPSVFPNVDGRGSVESCQKPKWGSPASPLSARYKQTQEEKSEDCTEENNSSKGEHESFEYDDTAKRNDNMPSLGQDEILSPRKSIAAQGSSFPFYNPNSKLTNPMTASSPIDEGKHRGFDDDDEITKLGDGGRFKKEVFSDDGCDEVSPYPGSRAQSPPSPDSSMTYPPHFPHPFFASPNRGHPSVQHLQFGSPRGPHESIHGAGYTYGKDFPGRFPIPGLAPDMGMGGPMSGHGGPYLGPMPSMGPMGDDKDIFFCHLCSYSGKSKPEFDAHMKFHFEYNCPHCDYTSRTEGRLKRHIKDFHSDDSARRSMPGRPKVYKCKQCQFSATEKDKFWEHARSHIKEDKLLQCPKCPFVTEYKHHLEYHLRNHFNSKPFKCNKCNYSCVNKSMLNSHMKSHTNVYQYRCSNCTYATKYCHSLKLHLRKYNHKPATVLNQDGSLPQGLDVEASGLSIVAKRGPPRGPRGPRKDKNEAYINHLYNMQPVSLGLNPMMNGMMPFWPMMPHMGIPGHPSGHSNMLQGIGNFPPPMRTDGDLKSQMESSSGDINDISSDDGSSFLKDEDVSCRLCDFVGETTQGLCLHFVQAHQNEAREVAKAYGVSEATMVESMTRSRLNTLTDKRRLSEPLVESDTEHNSHEFYERNSIAGLLSRKSPETQNDQRASQMSPSKWPVPYSPNSSMKHYRTGCLEVTDDNCGQVDILQQMTLKFGDGALSGPKAFPKEDVIKQFEPHHKETPLDLTKPKSVSPQMHTLPSSPDRDDYCYFQDKRPASANDFHSAANNAQLPLRKRAVIESEELEKVSGDAAKESSIVPRKRSRKGKAYKLDTLCMKLQKRQISTSLEADESGSDMEVNFKRFQPLQSAIGEREHENEVNKSSSVKEVDVDNVGASGLCNQLGDRKTKVECFEEKSDGEDTDEYEMKDDDDTDQESDRAILIESDNNSNDKGDRDDVDKKPDENVNIDSSNDAESEFEKLQRSLNILNNGLVPELEEAGRLGNPEFQGTENKSKIVKIESEKKKEDGEKSTESENVTEECRSEKTQDMEVDPVEMINTVLENRKKSLPPAVRRGTELAWKLLHDTVNPVTSIPLPIDSPPPSQAATISPATTTSMPGTGPVTIRNNTKLTPPFSYTTRNYPPHHSTQPLLNPPIPMPIPPTPMAFIPPTSHMIPESAMIRPGAPLKLSKHEEYSCTFCGLSFQDCVMYTVHMGYHSNKNPFKCNSCGIVCRDKVEFFLHIARSPHA